MPSHHLLARWLLAVAVLSASLPLEAATESDATKAEGDPLAAYSQSEAFTHNITWHKQVQKDEIRTSWFLRGSPGIAMVCTADLSASKVTTSREVYNHASQSAKTRELSHAQVLTLRKLIEGLPPSAKAPEFKNLVLVSVVENGQVKTSLYNRLDLPRDIIRLYDLTGAYLDTDSMKGGTEAFSYPPATEQRDAVTQMSDAIRQMQPGEQDVMLRRVLERCSVRIAEEFWTELQNSTSGPAELRKNTSALLKRLREIREFDEKSAPEFVSQAIAAKNPSALCVAIFALRTEELQGSAATGLGELGDPVAVRCLALRLRQATSLATGGVEQQMSRIQLRKSLIAALSAVTEIEMTVDGSEDAANKALEATQVWSVKQTGKNQSSINLEQRLKGVQQGTVSNESGEKIKAVREARDSGSPEHIPSLLQIAQTYAEPRKDAENLPWPVKDASLAFEALDAADALGDIKQDLLSYAQDHKRRMYLACCAIRILGRDADAELMAKLEKIHDQSTHNYVRGAVSEARTAFTVNRHLKGLETPREQIAFVLSRFGCDWNPIVEVTQESESRKKPVYVWSQKQMLRLSELHPAEVARAVHDLEYDSTMDAVYNRSFREYVVNHFLSKEAKSEFRKLEQNQPAPGATQVN